MFVVVCDKGEDFDNKEGGCDNEEGGSAKVFIHVLCLPGWQLVQPFLFQIHIQLLWRALTPLHLQHGIYDDKKNCCLVFFVVERTYAFVQ